MKKLFMIYLVICFSTSSLYAQNRTIKGRVLDEDLETLPYVSILVNDTVIVGRTDLNGYFQISIPLSEKRLLFNFVGMESASTELADKCNEVEVVMMLSSTYDFITPRKIEKLQLKRFKKLPERHKKAFEKGLFKTGNACYKREYLPYCKAK